MDEIFKEIPGSGGRYKVSNLGRVYNVKKQKIQTPIIDNSGNLFIGYVDEDGKHVNCYIRKVVASLFLDNPNNYSGVGFKDSNRHNCSVNNLYYYQKLSDIKKDPEKLAEYNRSKYEEKQKIKNEYKARIAEERALAKEEIKLAKEAEREAARKAREAEKIRLIQEKKEERIKAVENRENIKCTKKAEVALNREIKKENTKLKYSTIETNRNINIDDCKKDVETLRVDKLEYDNFGIYYEIHGRYTDQQRYNISEYIPFKHKTDIEKNLALDNVLVIISLIEDLVDKSKFVNLEAMNMIFFCLYKRTDIDSRVFNMYFIEILNQ